MFSINFKRLTVSRKVLRFSVSYESTFQSEYTQSPVYPKILDMSKKAVLKREREELHEKYKKLDSVEEKLFAINLPKYYGWKSVLLKEGDYPYNFLPFVKRITRTKLIKVEDPVFQTVQQVNPEEVKELVEKIRPQLQDALLFQLKSRRWRHEIDETGGNLSHREVSDIICNAVVQQINGTILGILSNLYPHLLESVVDFEPRLESFWAVGGFHPSDELYKEREENKDLSEEERSELVEHWLQYFGEPCIQLRSTLPLKVLNLESIGADGELTDEDFKTHHLPDPDLAFGLKTERRQGTNIPGFWPGDKGEFGLLSFHKRGHLIDRPPHFGSDELNATLDAQALLASFAWLHAQANYQGFSTFNEISYPFSTQNIITDGRNFSFYLYQLNTTLLHSDYREKNPRINMCLSQPTKALYEKIDGNEFVGWNDEVLSSLLACYINKPEKRIGVEMKPNVNATQPLLANIEDDERRAWLHKQFRHMYSNRPRHFLPYEIYDWERIYKIKFETRQMEARRRPFELDANPLEERKHSDYLPAYIPKKFRTNKKHWTGWRAKRAKKFYPEL